jgi:hypothetical protein
MDKETQADVKLLPISQLVDCRNWLPGVEAIAQGDSFGELGTLSADAI